MLDPIKYESLIKIEDIPIQWIPRLELFYSDLPQFPIVYVHTVNNGVRIYGFPACISVVVKEGENCDIEINFLSNIDLDANAGLKKIVAKELGERFGSSNKIGINDVLDCCNGDRKYEELFKELWVYVSDLYGNYIQYGKYYEEVYSIVRFVSAWQPKTGRQSEMRMLYNFLSIFGEPVQVHGKWDHLSFFLIPSYDDIRNSNMSEFPRFQELFDVMSKIWEIYFTNKCSIDGMTIRSMDDAWPRAKDDFINEVSYPLYATGKLSMAERNVLERLVDAFNRLSWRAAYFIWSIMSLFEKDYRSWSKEFFVKFYLNNNGVGISEKVVACFLQQGFGNKEVIPLDIWVESFYEYVLGIDSKASFFTTFKELGKLERVIWLSSQANKTNIRAFFDLMWCTRFGVTGNNELRGSNPIACYECRLRSKCAGYSKIKERNVLVRDAAEIDVDGQREVHDLLLAEAMLGSCLFLCLTEEKVPKKIYKVNTSRRKARLVLVDEFSGYLLTDQALNDDNAVLTVDELVSSLPAYFSD